MRQKLKTYTVYVHFARRTLIVGHYKAQNPEVVRRMAMGDLADMFKMSVLPQAAYEGRPYLAKFLEALRTPEDKF